MITVQVDFGSGWEDISAHCSNISKETFLHSDLLSTVSTCAFDMTDKITATKFLTAGADCPVQVDKNGVAWFRGVVRPNAQHAIGADVQSGRIEVYDKGIWLQRRCDQSLLYNGYKVCDPSAKAQSILHQLFYKAGVTDAELSLSLVDATIDYFTVEREDGAQYKEVIDGLLFEHGWVFYCGADGVFRLKDMYPNPVTLAGVLQDRNIYHNLVVSKRESRYQAVRVAWNPHLTLSGRLLYSCSKGASSGSRCNVPIAAGDYFPEDSDLKDIYTEYRVDDYELIIGLNETLNYDGTGISLNAWVPGFRRALVKFYSASGGALTMFDIMGDAVVRDTNTVHRSVQYLVSNSEEILELKTRWLTSKTTADRLANGLAKYHNFADYTYTFPTEEPLTLGNCYQLQEAVLDIDTKIRVVKVVEDELGLLQIEAEGIDDFSAGSIEEQDTLRAPRTTTEARADSALYVSKTEDQAGYTGQGGTTTPTPVTVAVCKPVGTKAIALKWDRQLNLTNFDHHEVQVSDDNGDSWYSLKFDGTDWKDQIGALTSWQTEFLVHPGIPHTGTAEDPAGRLLYYRVRRVTKAPANGDWSATASATTKTVAAGDLAEDTIYANNIIAAEIATMLLRATTQVIIGQDYTGTPPAGSQQVVCDDNELRLDEWDGSAWVVIFRIGGNDMLKWYLQARGLIKTGADISGLEIGDGAPNGTKVFDFENDVLDKAGTDYWEGEEGLAYSALMKFGAKALTHATGKIAVLRDESALGITNSDFGLSAWHYKPSTTKNKLLWSVVKDGTWTSRTSASALGWQSVCWSPELGLFCAVAYDGVVGVQVMTSPDGTTWTSRTSASAQQWRSVCWSPELSLFCAVAANGIASVQVMTSPDGITWTSRTSASAQTWISVCWSPELDLFCAVANSGVVGVQVMTSPDGITWTSRTSASAQGWRSVCWSPELGLFCAVASDGAIGVQVMTSPDGITWTSRTSASAQQWYGLCWSPELSLFCAVAANGIASVQVMTSPDGITWTSRTSASAQIWRSVCWSPELGLFCAVASDGAIGVQVMTSPDGITWTSRTSASALGWQSVCWSPELGLFCAVAYNGAVGVQVMTSPLSGMRLYATPTGYRLIVGASSPTQDRAATAGQWHHVGMTERNVTGQQKWGLAVDEWSTEVNIAAHPITTGSRLVIYLHNSARLDDMASLAASALLSLAEMCSHYAIGQPWVDASTGVDALLDLVLMAKTGGKIKLLSATDAVGGLAWPMLYIEDQKAAGTPGGTFTSGAWQKRDLYPIVVNEIPGASLASSQITLPAGTYEARFNCPAFMVAQHKAKLYNTTTSADLIIGLDAYTHTASSSETISNGFGRFTLAAQSVLELQHMCQTTVAGNGLGVTSNFGVVEVYSTIEIRKVT